MSPFLRGLLGVPSVSGFPSGARVDLDATTITGLTDNQAITAWADASGSGNHATMTGSSAPRYRTAAVNAHPAVEWRSATTDDAAIIPTAARTGLTAAEAFLVVLPRSAPDTGHPTLWSFNDSIGQSRYPHSDGTYYDGFMSSVRRYFGSAYPLDVPHIYNVASGPGDFRQWLDGTLLRAETTNTFQSTGGLALGFGFGLGFGDYATLKIGRFLLFPRILSAGERAAVTSALRTQFGTRAAPVIPTTPLTVAAVAAVAPSPVYFYGPTSPKWADLAGTTPSAEGGAVQRWDDLVSGRQASYVASTSASPTRRQYGAGWRESLRIDDTDDVLLPAGASFGADMTVICVYAPTTTSSFRRTLNGGASNWLVGVRAGFHSFYAGGFVSSTHASAAAQVGKYVCVSARTSASAGGGAFRVNGVDCTQSSAPNTAPGAIYFGGKAGAFTTEPGDCDLVYAIAWNRRLTDAETSAVEALVRADVGI